MYVNGETGKRKAIPTSPTMDTRRAHPQNKYPEANP